MSNDESEWTGVTGEPNEAEAELVAGFLRDHDIPARVVDNSFHLAPNPSEDLTPIEVAVPTARVEEARAILAKRQKDFGAQVEGAETVMTDEGLADIDSQGTENG
jgi:hypothetical protein